MAIANSAVPGVVGSAQASQGIGFTALLAAIISSLVVFVVQLCVFLLLKDRVVNILYVGEVQHMQR